MADETNTDSEIITKAQNVSAKVAQQNAEGLAGSGLEGAKEEAEGFLSKARGAVADATKTDSGNIFDSIDATAKELTDKVKENKLGGKLLKSGNRVLDLVDPEGIVKGTVGELDQLTDNLSEYTDLAAGRKTFKDVFGMVSGSGFAQQVLDNSAKGELKTFLMPEDYDPDLCFRMDMIKFDRQSVFKPVRATPQATFIFPLPKTLSVGQGVGFKSVELGAAGEVEARLRKNADFSGSIGDIAGKLMGEVGGQVASSLYRAGLQTDTGKAASMALGFIPNPHLANIFTGMEMRTFTFSVSIAPRSQREADTLNHTLDHLKSYVLPAVSDNLVTMEYPHEVALSFSEAGSTLVEGGIEVGRYKTPLDRMFKFKRCVCTNVTYEINGQSSQQSFFDDRSPTEVTINFQFTESQIQMANDYGHGPKATNAQKFIDTLGNKAKDLESAFDSTVAGARARNAEGGNQSGT
jgi:hypothetical protein